MAGDFEVMITADEAWPAFERAVLSARSHVVAGFRIFDLSTRLRSTEAREIGQDWFDLLAHALRRGVRIDLTVSDFDPVMATDLHELSWRTVRQGVALAEATGAGKDLLNIRAHQHSARAGMLPRLAFLPAVLRRRWERLRETTPVERRFEAVGLERSVLPNLHTVSHHQKVAVIDDEWLYVGGLDLNERRYDTPGHDRPARHTWSDVQVMLRGPEAAAARRHLESFQAVTEGRAAPPPCPGLKRTLSAPRRLQLPYLSPRTLVSEIEEAHLEAFRKARHLIHIETQFIRSSRIAEALAEAATRNRDLNAIIVMPGLPEDVAFDSSESLDARYGLALRQQAVATLRESFGDRLTIATPVRPVLAARDTCETLAGSPLIHVHNKVLIRDAASVLIGSANLNGRSMRWDTELAVEITQPERVERARERLLSHWWHEPLAPEAMSPETLYPLWQGEIRRNGLRRPENRSGFLVPFDAEEGADLAQDLPGVTEDIV
ncbi:phospholipase D family protein [Mameliella alba]|uniref:Phospholipase D n=1 Tax=Mameliella alba TaxID=561184 RepID=A0A0B3S471_9RHOB|nr:phospholipase D family protein [Mameliella alba]KHQ51481.1 Phosphatidylserine/phosphatidylglycerophosphate/ cardiolipin synthases-like protein [Mameliella alba]